MPLINFYFERHRGLANGIVSAASGIGSVIYPYIYRALILEYEFRGALLLLGGILFNCCVAGSLCRQPIQILSGKVNASDSFLKFVRKVFTFRWSLFKNISFCCLDIGFAFTFLAFISVLYMLPAHLVHLGYTKYDAALCMLILGIAEPFPRLFIGWFTDLKLVTPSIVYSGCMAIGGVTVICLSLTSSYIAICVCAALVGAFPGMLFTLMPVIVVEKVGLQFMPAAMGLVSLSWSILFLVGQPMLGKRINLVLKMIIYMKKCYIKINLTISSPTALSQTTPLKQNESADHIMTSWRLALHNVGTNQSLLVLIGTLLK